MRPPQNPRLLTLHHVAFVALGCLLSRAPCAGAAEEPKPLGDTDYQEIYSHLIRPEPVVLTPWTDITNGEQGKAWDFDLTVDEHGDVTAATLKSGPKELREEATRAARAIRFRPFKQDGKALSVRLSHWVQTRTEDYVGPADRAFRPHPPPESTVITLLRTACFGTCPGYRVELRGTGEVTYRGDDYVLVRGLHQWRVDPKSVAELLDLFKRSDYFHLKGYYELQVSDLPTYITSLRIGKQGKFVLDYGGSGFGEAVASTSFGSDDPHMPATVTELESAVDRVAGTASWVTGDDKTIARLRASNWNFQSKESGEGLGVLLGNCNTHLAREFIRAGAPVSVLAHGFGGALPIVLAARCDDIGLVRLLTSRGALGREGSARAFLEAAADAGYPDMVAFALRYYRGVNIKEAGGMPLISRAAAAIQADGPIGARFDSTKVIQLLIGAGANPNARDADGNTPLFETNSEGVARALIKGGADPNARNCDGQTPLFVRYFDEPKRALIQAGADVRTRDKSGRTALFYQDDTDSVKMLLQAGADVNAIDSEGLTPIEFAANENVAAALLAAGAKLPTDPLRLSALLHTAIEKKWTKLLPQFQRAANPK
jgi:ankyrin repeat protein